MSSTALKTLAVILVIAAAVLGFVAYQFSQRMTETPEQAEKPPQPGENQVLAVVAVKRIPPYQPISQEAVSLVPISVQPPQYYTDTSEVIGRTPLRAIPMGAPVTDESFGNANTLAQAIPEDSQAMSLEISDVIAVGGFVKPGDLVDVLVYIRASGREVEDTQARVLLKSARVLSYEERLINAASDDSQQGRERAHRQRTAVLAVPKDETTRVMLGASLGELRLALRGEERLPGVAQEQPASAGATDVADRREAVAPSASGSADDSGKTEKDKDKDKDKVKDQDNEDKVITLSELAAIKNKKQAKSARRAPPRALIEIYQGTKRTRISRPY